MAERLGDDLRVHGARALADLRRTDQYAHAAPGEGEAGARGELDLAAAGEAAAVKEERDAGAAHGRRARMAAERAPGLARAPVVVRSRHLALLLIVRPHHECVLGQRAVEHLVGRHRVLELLAGSGDVAGAEQVLLAQLDRIELQLAGDAIHVHLGGELRLRRAEAAEGAVGRCVRHHDAAAHADRLGAVGTRCVDGGAREHDGAERDVGAAVEAQVDVDGEDGAVFRHGGAVADDRRVALGGSDEILVALVDHLHRAARLAREQHGVAGQNRRILLLAAEAAAGGRLHDAHLVTRQPGEDAQRAYDVVRALHRAVARSRRRRRAWPRRAGR